MTKLIKKFTGFMQGALKLMVTIDLIVAVGLACISIESINRSVLIFGFIALFAYYLGYKFINMNMSSNNKLLFILIIGFSLRVLWILNVNSIPTSDFKTIYDNAGSFINGDRSMFYGTSYLGRFPHLTVITLYMAFIRYLFPINNLLVMKIINVFLSMLVLLLIYLIIEDIYRSKEYALKGVLFGTIFPPFISYSGVLCSENIAMPLYLLSIFLFLRAIRLDSRFLIVLSGAILAIGNLFRMVATVMLIAFSIYLLLYYKDKLVSKIKKLIFLIAPYAMIICFVSLLLQTVKITDHPLWKGSEPSITSILKGTNYESFGAWNSKDAETVEDNINNYDRLEGISKEIIKERLTTTPLNKLAVLFFGKFSLVWSTGDCAGVLWSQKDVSNNEIKYPVETINLISMPLSTTFQIIFIVVLFLMLIGLFNKNKIKNIKELNLFYLILCGYGVTYIITEAQPRYSYIVSWLFVILSINGLDYLKIFRNSFDFSTDYI